MPDIEDDEPTPAILGQAAEGTAYAGMAPLPPWLDVNGNGLADVLEPEWLIRAAAAITGLVVQFAPSHTVFYRYADFYRKNVLPRLEDKP